MADTLSMLFLCARTMKKALVRLNIFAVSPELSPLTNSKSIKTSCAVSLTHIRTSVLKIVTFKGGHLMWKCGKSDFQKYKELLLKKEFAPFGSEISPLRGVPISKRDAIEGSYCLIQKSPFNVGKLFQRSGILTFISMINTTSERLKARNFCGCR